MPNKLRPNRSTYTVRPDSEVAQWVEICNDYRPNLSPRLMMAGVVAAVVLLVILQWVGVFWGMAAAAWVFWSAQFVRLAALLSR